MRDLVCLMILIIPSVLCDECWVARTGRTEWCNGYCCDTPVNGWGCCCDDGDDMHTVVLGLTAILLWTLGAVLLIVKVVTCYLGGDIFAEIHRKIKRRIAKRRREKEEQYLLQLSEKQQLCRFFKENFSEAQNDEWRKMAKLYEMDVEGDDEIGHELSCLCCDKYRITLGKV